MPIDAGTRVGRYEIRAPLGAGGMGEVYLAQDTELERSVALKVLPHDVASDKQRMERFIREAKTASALNHPNILTIYEIGHKDETHFIATEFIEGETLRQHLKGARMKMSDVLSVAIQTADALSAAHEANIVHRDIKPENIILRKRDAYVKVVDFGLAKLTEQQSPTIDTEAPTLFKTEEGAVIGTVSYMSPEQAKGSKVDARTDIWSLGVMLFETVAGCLPFEGSTTSETLASILNEKEPPPLARFAREVPAELERIVEKALRKDREERYQTIKDMLLDLRSLRHRLQFEAELERSQEPPFRSTGVSTGARQTPIETIVTSAARSSNLTATPQTSSAEYLFGEIKRHERGAVIALAVVMTLATITYFYFARINRSITASQAIDSMAVLPFVNVNANSDMEYLSDGLTDSLINSLSQLPKLKVIARSSVFSYKGKEIEPQAVGRELNVQALVTGRITQRGDNLSISVELVDTRDKSHIWGEQYNRRISDLLAVQEEISREISEKLRLKLTGEEQKRVTKRYTENPQAYQLYLKGRYFGVQFTEEGFKKAVEHFNQAIEKDPNYALAYTGLAEAYWVVSAQTLSPREAMPKAREAAVKALRIDETLAEAHTALAMVQAFYDYDVPGAEKEFKRAIELNPGSASAHQWYGWYLAVLGRPDEALKEIKLAQELDPLSLTINTELGMPFYFTSQYDRAIEQFKKGVEMDPNGTFARGWLALTYIQKGMYEEATTAANKSDDPYLLASTAHAYALLGKTAEAQRIIEQLKKQARQRYVPPYIMARTYVGLGEKEQAIEWLEKSYENREDAIIWLNSDPALDGLRSEPRFQDLVRRVGLPQ